MKRNELYTTISEARLACFDLSTDSSARQAVNKTFDLLDTAIDRFFVDPEVSPSDWYNRWDGFDRATQALKSLDGVLPQQPTALSTLHDSLEDFENDYSGGAIRESYISQNNAHGDWKLDNYICTYIPASRAVDHLKDLYDDEIDLDKPENQSHPANVIATALWSASFMIRNFEWVEPEDLARGYIERFGVIDGTEKVPLRDLHDLFDKSLEELEDAIKDSANAEVADEIAVLSALNSFKAFRGADYGGYKRADFNIEITSETSRPAATFASAAVAEPTAKPGEEDAYRVNTQRIPRSGGAETPDPQTKKPKGPVSTQMDDAAAKKPRIVPPTAKPTARARPASSRTHNRGPRRSL